MIANGAVPVGWQAGSAPVAVVMIALNERHNIAGVLQNLKGWAQEVILVDSYSQDDTVDIALQHGVRVVQRAFRGFGDQWNFALRELHVAAAWTMKLDPDERLTDALKASIIDAIAQENASGIAFDRRLWFMGRPLPIGQEIIRVWKTGSCRFTDVTVNEHPIVSGRVVRIEGILEHHDSPDLHHWLDKQNRYTTAEALARYRKAPFAVQPSLVQGSLARRMWLKKNFTRLPLRYQILFLANLLRVRPWVTGRAGLTWARLRVWVHRMIEDKFREMCMTGVEVEMPSSSLGLPHPRARQYDS